MSAEGIYISLGIGIIPITIYLLYVRFMMHDQWAILLRDFKKVFVLRRAISTVTQNFFFLLALVALAIGYTCLAYRADNIMIPHWDALSIGVKNLYKDSRNGEHILWNDTIASFSRLIPAIALAGAIGIPIGLYMGVYAAAESLLGRIIEFVGNIPPNAMMVLFLTLFGFDFTMYIAVIVCGILPSIIKGSYLTSKSVSNEHIYGVKTLGASNQEVVWSVIYKMTLPQLIEIVGQTVAPAIIFLIGAEWVSGTTGFGHRFSKLYHSARMDVMFPYLIYMGFIGIGRSLLFKRAQRLLCKWYSEENK